MKMYNYNEKFVDVNGNEKIRKEETYWSRNKQSIVDKANETVKISSSWQIPLDIEIIEKDFENPIVCLEGEVDNNGKQYGDFEITIGDKTIYDEIYRKFKGNKVRLTVELID